MNTQAKDVLTTIAYYDAMDYPLTSFEVWKYLTKTVTQPKGPKEEKRPATLSEIIKGLHNDATLRQMTMEKDGFYFLRGREGLVERRLKHNRIAIKKMKKIYLIAKLLRLAPFVRMTMVTGRLAMKMTEKKSDLDLLIVCKAGHIWTARAVVTIFLHALGLRRHGEKTNDRACLNHFLTADALEIMHKDYYAANEYMVARPLFGEVMFRRFQIRNYWIKKIKPRYTFTEVFKKRTFVPASKVCKVVQKFGEYILQKERIERFLKRIQYKKIMKNPKTKKEGSIIIANDKALIFLPSPHGPKVFERFQKSLQRTKT
ncbi:MAG: hypothetical protein KC736_01890 [Candidatus Moranbacteria bacterium]|nr:hypothetical protein [Candidatus Moranbacteria bacterium]